MIRAVAVLTIVGLAASRDSRAQLPPGYEVVTAAGSNLVEIIPHVNVHRQVVYMGRVGSDNTTSEIFLFDSLTGETTQITDNNWYDGVPDVNDAGVIAWTSNVGGGPVGPGYEIMLRFPDGSVTQLTDDRLEDGISAINNANQVAWWRSNGRGCEATGSEIMFFDGQTTRQITDNDFSNQDVGLNDRAEIIWTQFNFCPGGFNWRSRIKLYRDGEITTLSPRGLQAQGTSINNQTVCVWHFSNPDTLEQGIVVWRDGATTMLTDWGRLPVVNDRGDVAFQRWHDETGTLEAWLYRDGRFHMLSTPGERGYLLAMNNRSEVVWVSGPVSEADIKLMRRLPLGDLNCDGIVDALDIEPFLVALLDPGEYLNRFADCDISLADINEDGSVNALDIEPFIELLFP